MAVSVEQNVLELDVAVDDPVLDKESGQVKECKADQGSPCAGAGERARSLRCRF